MGKLIDITNMKFGRWTVVERAEGRENTTKAMWRCACECGNEKIISSEILRRGGSKSCGCYNIEVVRERSITHGMSNHDVIHIWHGMLDRCFNPNLKHYKNYGGRGISVCERWKDINKFIEDMGERPGPEYSIERVDTNGNYDPSNCKWATRDEQNRNRRLNKTNTSGHRGVSLVKHTGKWLSYINIKHEQIRIGYFNTIEEAIEARKQAEIQYWGKSS